MGPAGFEPATSSARGHSVCSEVAIDGFETYLSKVLTSRKDKVYLTAIANKYKHVLETCNASELQTLSHDKKRQVMRALAHLAKFNGTYEQWQKIIRNHGLHWRETNNDDFRLFEQESITDMLAYVKETMKILPTDCANTFVVATLLGLRADEVCNAIRLIQQDVKDYYNVDRQILEHYKHKAIFIRRSKKAYISLVDGKLLNLAKQANSSYQAIQSYPKRRNTVMKMGYCRKIFGTWLRQNGIESEFIDVLQGRVPSSIFAKHYYRPDEATISKARGLIKELQTKLTDCV